METSHGNVIIILKLELLFPYFCSDVPSIALLCLLFIQEVCTDYLLWSKNHLKVTEKNAWDFYKVYYDFKTDSPLCLQRSPIMI